MTTTNDAIDTTAPNTPVAAAPALDDSGQFVTLSSLLIVAAATAAITLFAVYAGASKGYFPGTGSASSAASKVVMLDVDRIAEAAISANAKKGPGTDPKADVELFQSNLKKEIDQLSAAGFMVVNYRAVVAASKNADVTDQLITRLGLNTGEVK